MPRRTILVVAAAAGLSACAGQSDPIDGVVIGPAASSATPISEDYRIGPLDQLAVDVFQVEALSVEELRVDASGRVEMPLIGTVPAAGATAAELAERIREKLQADYLRNPRVTVRVIEAGSQKITVDGAVREPGVYEMQGRTTLMQAVAMAKGATGVSNVRRVAVFRTMDGQRTAAVFDLAAIRAGEAQDPQLEGDDIVVVDTSRLSIALRNVVSALPGLATFRAY